MNSCSKCVHLVPTSVEDTIDQTRCLRHLSVAPPCTFFFLFTFPFVFTLFFFALLTTNFSFFPFSFASSFNSSPFSLSGFLSGPFSSFVFYFSSFVFLTCLPLILLRSPSSFSLSVLLFLHPSCPFSLLLTIYLFFLILLFFV